MSIRNRTTLFTALLVLGAVVLTGAVSGSASGSRVQTLHVLATPGKVVYLDFPPKGKSPGDLYVVTSQLLNPNTHRVIGRLRGTQTHITFDSGVETVQAMLTYQLGAGNQIIVGGVSSYAPHTPPGLITGKTFVRAVIGGTGRYDGARGEEYTTHLRNGYYDHVFRLTF